MDLDVLVSGIHKVLNHGMYHLYFFRLIYQVYFWYIIPHTLNMNFKENYLMINLGMFISFMSNYNLQHTSVLGWRFFSDKIYGI